MTFSTSIQSILGTHIPVGTGNSQCAPDWGRDRVFFQGVDGTGAASYLSRGGLLTGTEEAHSTLTPYNASIISPVGLDNTGNVYLSLNPAGIQRGIAQINGGTLALITSAPSATSNAGLGGFSCVESGSDQYMMDTGVGGAFFAALQQLYIYLAATEITHEDWPSGGASFTCSGKPNSKKGFMVNCPTAIGDPQFLTLSSILIDSGVVTFTNLGTVDPTDVDVTWTQIYANGMCCDQTDGHMLVAVHGHTAATQKNYIIKLSSVDASVLWVCPVPPNGAVPAGGAKQMAFSRIKHQKLALLTSGPNTVTIINTADGTSSSFTTGLAGITVAGAQCYDDTSSGLLCSIGFAETTGSPTLLNSTPSSYSGWFVLYVADEFVPPVLGSGGAWFDVIKPFRAAA